MCIIPCVSLTVSSHSSCPFSTCSTVTSGWKRKIVIETSSIIVTYHFLDRGFLLRMGFPSHDYHTILFRLVIPDSFSCLPHLWNPRKRSALSLPPRNWPWALHRFTSLLFIHPVSMVSWRPGWLLPCSQSSFKPHFCCCFLNVNLHISWRFQLLCLATLGSISLLGVLLLLFPWMLTASLRTTFCCLSHLHFPSPSL